MRGGGDFGFAPGADVKIRSRRMSEMNHALRENYLESVRATSYSRRHQSESSQFRDTIVLSAKVDAGIASECTKKQRTLEFSGSIITGKTLETTPPRNRRRVYGAPAPNAHQARSPARDRDQERLSQPAICDAARSYPREWTDYGAYRSDGRWFNWATRVYRARGGGWPDGARMDWPRGANRARNRTNDYNRRTGDGPARRRRAGRDWGKAQSP